MASKLRRRFWIESALAGLSAVLFALTMVSPTWIELVFGADLDGGDGSLEWTIVAALAIVTAVFTLLARVEWRRAAMRRA
ncbi:MAG: hypothetical protein ACM3ZF_13235 [Mycobacterium leprae]